MEKASKNIIPRHVSPPCTLAGHLAASARGFRNPVRVLPLPPPCQKKFPFDTPATHAIVVSSQDFPVRTPVAEAIEEDCPPWFQKRRIRLAASVLAVARLFDIRPQTGRPGSEGTQTIVLPAFNKLTN